MKLRQKWRVFNRNKELFLLSLPGVAMLFVFFYIPIYGFILPFKRFRYDLGLWKSPWVGFDNFRFLFNSDTTLKITRNTIGLNALFIVSVLIASLTIALMINELGKRSVKVYQTAMFFPYFISWVVGSYILLALLDMEHGMVNNLLIALGREDVLWYNEPRYWPVILTLSSIWKDTGYFAIIYYAGLIGIDREYYEAAEIDGATRLQQIRLISIPLISPLISMLLLVQVGRIFYGNFDLFYNLTRNSVMLYSTTDVIDTFVFRSLRTMGDVGMSSAAGVYQAVLGLVIIVTANKIIKSINSDHSLF